MVFGAFSVIVGSIAAAIALDYPTEIEAGAVGASVLASLGLLWPVVGPFLEVKRLAAMEPAEIEEAVRVKEPLSLKTTVGKLFGEDALLDWPGASGPLLRDRDEFMAKAAANVASGRSRGHC